MARTTSTVKKVNSFVEAVTTDVTKSKKDGLTANGAVTRKTSGKTHLDLFAIAGSARNAQNDVVSLFTKAYADDKELALRILLWLRDIRGGAGERQAFRNVIRHLAVNDPVVVEKLIPYVAEYARWDDMIESLPVMSTLFVKAAKEVKNAIDSGNGLASKWCARKGAVAVALRDAWGMSPKQYRRFVVDNTKVVETLMCNKEWDEIEFDKLPSLAGLRYQKAFARNAPENYEIFKTKLVKGETKINVSTLFPHNIVTNVRMHTGDEMVMNESWKALPNYLGDKSGNVLVMSDVSSSMMIPVSGNTTALDVSVALGMYTAERLSGPFKDMVLTFSTKPKLHLIKGMTLSERYNNLVKANWEMSTNLQAAFKLVLDTGILHATPQEDMPETIVVISDMEFNKCANKTNFGGIKTQYKDAGYKMPKLVFWNVNSRKENNPVKHDEDGACMVSGFSPAILQSVLTDKEYDPMSMMMEVIMNPRYDVVKGL